MVISDGIELRLVGASGAWVVHLLVLCLDFLDLSDGTDCLFEGLFEDATGGAEVACDGGWAAT